MKLSKIALLMACISVLPMAQTKITVVGKPGEIIVNQTPSDESLRKLMQAMQMEKTLNDMNNQNKGMIDQIMQQAFNNNPTKDELTQSQKNQLQALTSDFTKALLDEQNKPEYRQQLINTYIETAKTIYTQAEVNAMIDFYGSPIGQSVIEKQTTFGSAYMQKILPMMMANQQKIMQKLLPNFQQKMERIMAQPSKNQQKVKK